MPAPCVSRASWLLVTVSVASLLTCASSQAARNPNRDSVTRGTPLVGETTAVARAAWSAAVRGDTPSTGAFTFVHLSDLHIGAPKAEKSFKDALDDVERRYPEAEFVIITGDVTDMGTREQFTSFTKIADAFPKRVYCVPGNHDARWAPNGKEDYRDCLGPTNQVFIHKGVKFILTDSSMLCEHYGHFDGGELATIRNELASLKLGEPAIIALHHPILNNSRYVDNDGDLGEILRRHNVPLALVGHGHGVARYRVNGTEYSMGGSTLETTRRGLNYRVYRVGVDPQDGIKSEIRNFARRRTTRDKTTIPLEVARSRAGDLALISKPAWKAPLHFAIGATTSPALKAVSFVVDETSAGLAKSSGKNRFMTQPLSLPNGVHSLSVSFRDDRGETSTRNLRFETSDPTGPVIKRVFDLGAGCQSHPVVDDDTLYVAANDAVLRAIDLEASETLWERNLGSEILSAPVIDDRQLFIGSLDKNMYCLDKDFGGVTWKRNVRGGIMSTPLVTSGTVYFGAGDNALHALDAKTGHPKWKASTERHVKMTPAALPALNALVFGAWDNRIYCVDATSGVLQWKIPASVERLYSAATSNIVPSGAAAALVSTHDYKIRALDAKSGSHLWMWCPPDKERLGPSYSSPVVVGDNAYFATIDGRILGFNVATGRPVCDVELRPGKADGVFDSIPCVADGKLYVGTVGGNLYCVNLAAAKVEWSIALQPGFIFTRPVVWRDRVLVATMDGKVYEIQRPKPATPPTAKPARRARAVRVSTGG